MWWRTPVPSKNRWIIKFEGIDNRDQSEAANGIVLYGEADDPEDMLEADEWYPKDLIGLEARLAEDNMLGLEPGVVVGKVVDVIEAGPMAAEIRLANPVKVPTALWLRTARLCHSWTSSCQTSTSKRAI